MSQPKNKITGRGFVFLVVVFGGASLGGLIALVGLVTDYRNYTSGPGKHNPTWSPDGTRISYCYQPETGCWVMDADGRNSYMLANTADEGKSPKWSPDWTQFAYCYYGECYLADADGSNLMNLTKTVDVEDHSLIWSPDGSRMAFVSEHAGGADVYLVSSDGGNPTRLTHDSQNYYRYRPLTWSPDGSRITRAGWAGWSVIDASSGKQLGPTGDNLTGNLAWSQDGTGIATSDIDGIYLTNADGEPLVKTNFNTSGSLSWSPDGTHILFTSDLPNGTDGEDGFYVMNADGISVTLLAADLTETLEAPVWSPDGTHIAFIGERISDRSNEQLYVVEPDGSKLLRLTNWDGSFRELAWSPDGSRIVFVDSGLTNGEIFVVDPDGKNLTKLTGKSIWDWLVPWG